MVESRDELTLACHLQFNFSSAHVSRHRSTSTIITIRGRRREETHKIIRDNQFNGIHYRPRYNKSTITITIPQNQRKKKRRRRRIEQNPREREKKKSHIHPIRFDHRSKITIEFRGHISNRGGARFQQGFNLITTLLLCPFVTEEDNTSSNYGVDLADEDARFEDTESLSYNGQTHRSLALS